MREAEPMSATSSADRIFDLELDLLIGSRGEFTEAEPERGWRVDGRELTEGARARSGCWRPWGWWRFEAGREEPCRAEEVVYLAECGELTDAEVAAIAERANEARIRIGTPAEHCGGTDGSYRPDRDAVKLHEAVIAAPRGAPILSVPRLPSCLERTSPTARRTAGAASAPMAAPTGPPIRNPAPAPAGPPATSLP
jgi:hypothetical protein